MSATDDGDSSLAPSSRAHLRRDRGGVCLLGRFRGWLRLGHHGHDAGCDPESGTASNQIYPGGQSAVAVTVTNPNPGAVKVGSLSLDSTQGNAGFAVDGAHAACGVRR